MGKCERDSTPRLDPCAGKGVVRLDSLQLEDASGKTLKQWP